MKIWFDTDIGGDIDDALALVYAMASKDIELMGVSTVFENTELRAKIAKKLLELGGLPSVPVYAGIGKPKRAVRVHNYVISVDHVPVSYAPDIFEDAKIDGVDGVIKMAECLKNNPGLIIVATGALTNVAELLRKYPELHKNIGCLYIMGGAVGLNLNEFNFTCDPEAAAYVINSDVNKKVVTLDVTFQCQLSDDQIARLKECTSDLMKCVIRMHQLWGYGIILHDPLTMAVLDRPDFVKFNKGNLIVETEGEFSRGKCVNLCDCNWQKEGKDNLLVSSGVNSKDFTEYYVNMFCEYDKKLK